MRKRRFGNSPDSFASKFSDVYPAMADRVEAELGLRDAAVPAGDSRVDRHVPL